MSLIVEDARKLQSSKRSSRRIVLFFKGAISLLFFVILFHFVSAGDFLGTLRRVDLKFVCMSMVLSGMMIFISCMKWKILLDLQDKPIPLRILMQYYYIGYYFSNLLPSNIGGDVVRAYYAGRHINSQGHAAVSVFMERVTGLLLLLLLAILAPAVLPGLFTHAGIIFPALLAGFLLIFFGALLLIRRAGLGIGVRLHTFLDWLMRIPLGRRIKKWEDEMRASLDRFLTSITRLQEKLAALVGTLKKDQGAMLRLALITFFFYFLAFLNVYVSCRAFGAEADLLTIAAVVPTAMLVSMIPISLGSLGLAESSYVFYLGLIGINPAASLAIALLFRFKMLLNGLIGLILSNRRISL